MSQGERNDLLAPPNLSSPEARTGANGRRQGQALTSRIVAFKLAHMHLSKMAISHALKCSPESVTTALTCPYGRYMIDQGVLPVESLRDALVVSAGDSAHYTHRLILRGDKELDKRKPDTALTGQARMAAETILKGTVLPDRLRIEGSYDDYESFNELTANTALAQYIKAQAEGEGEVEEAGVRGEEEVPPPTNSD